MIYIGFDNEWRKIILDGKETDYSVSDMGNVRNDLTGNILSHIIGGNNKNYDIVKLWEHDPVTGKRINKCRDKLVSRLVATAFIPIPQKYIDMGYSIDDLVVDHIRDGDIYNQRDNSIYNLQWLTRAENNRKAAEAGLFKKENYYRRPERKKWGIWGEENAHHKYSEKAIRGICEDLVDNKLTMQEIADKHGTTKMCVFEIKSGRAWRHISKEYDFSHYDRKAQCNIYSKRKFQHTDIENAFADKLIRRGLKNKEIIGILKDELGMEKDDAIALLHTRRKQIGINQQSRSKFTNEFIENLDRLIVDGYSNKEIREILSLENTGATHDLLSSHRRKLGVLTKKQLKIIENRKKKNKK